MKSYVNEWLMTYLVKLLSNLIDTVIKDFVYTRRIITNCEFIQIN